MNGRGCPGSCGQPGWGSAGLPLFLPAIRWGDTSSGGRWLGRCPARSRGLVPPARKQAVIVCAPTGSAPGPLVQPGRGAGSEHCGAHCTPDGDSSAGSSSRSAGKPRAVLMQSWQPPVMSCPFSAASSPARGCHVESCNGEVLMDVPTETLSVPQSGFTPSRQSSFGTPLSRGRCPGLVPRPRAGRTARPRSPRGLELG